MSDQSMLGTFIVVGLVGLCLVARGNKVKNVWGVNLGAVNCPRCQAPLPRVRTPRSLRQALLGGSTCKLCGCEIDKWGRDISH